MSRAGDFARSRRPNVADHGAFIRSKVEAGVPISAIARMVGCHEPDVRAYLYPEPVQAEEPSPPRTLRVGNVTPIIETARPAVEACARAAGVSVDVFLSAAQPRKLSDARHACWATVYATGRYSLSQIGGWFGRDHTTILAGIARANGQAADDQTTQEAA